MALSDDQLHFLRENSKDETAFLKLCDFFNASLPAQTAVDRMEPEAPAITGEDFRLMADLAMDYTLMMHVLPDGSLRRGWIYGAFEQITGFTLEESEARGGWAALPHPDDLPLVIAEARKLLSAPQISELEYRIITKSGEIRHLRNRSRSYFDVREGRITRIYATVNDITERKAMENALRENQQFIAQIADSVPYIISVYDLQQGHYLYLNEYLINFLGLNSAQPTDLNVPDFRYIYPEDAALAEDMMRRVARASTDGYVEGDVRVKRADGAWRWLRLQLLPFQRDVDGKLKQVLGIGMDVTEMREIEQMRLDHQRLQVEFAKEQELSDLKSRMMRRISHEFRTPLAVIHASAEMLQNYPERMDAAAQNYRYEKIYTTITHMTTMLDDMAFILKDLARTTTLDLERIDPIKLCRGVYDELRLNLGAKHPLLLSIPTVLPPIQGDAELLQHALTHLLHNAVTYSPHGKAILLSAEFTDEHLLLHVRDQGIGVPAQEQERVFEPFFRGSNIQESIGLGLGLTIVQKIVQAHGGSITLKSEVNKGTVVTLMLRLHQPESRMS